MNLFQKKCSIHVITFYLTAETMVIDQSSASMDGQIDMISYLESVNKTIDLATYVKSI